MGTLTAAARCRPRTGKNRGRAIAVMHIAIDGHRVANFFVALHATDGDRYVVDHAEALAVIGERMMESAADADRNAIVERMISGQHGAARSQPEGLTNSGR